MRSGEMLSVAVIITECGVVAYVSLLQSCLVLYLHHHEDENVLPNWLVELLMRWMRRNRKVPRISIIKSQNHNEWDQLTAQQKATGDERVWSWMWNESAASALFRSAKLYSVTGGQKAAREEHNEVRRKFISPQLLTLWRQRVIVEADELAAQDAPSVPPSPPSDQPPSDPPPSDQPSSDSSPSHATTASAPLTAAPAADVYNRVEEWLTRQIQEEEQRTASLMERGQTVSSSSTAAPPAAEVPSQGATQGFVSIRRGSSVATCAAQEARAEPATQVQPRAGAPEAPANTAGAQQKMRRSEIAAAPDGPVPMGVDGEFLRKLLFFEGLFFALDANHSGSVLLSDLSRLLSYMDFTEPSASREVYVASGMYDQNKDGVIDRYEFLQVCVERLWKYDLSVLRLAAANFANAQKVVVEGPIRYWRSVGTSVDTIMAQLLPVCHMTFIAIFLNITFHDDYEKMGDTPEPMALGFLRPTMSPTQIAVAVTIPAMAVVLLLLWLCAKRKAIKLNATHKDRVAEDHVQSMIKKQSVWMSEKSLLSRESRPTSVDITQGPHDRASERHSSSTWRFSRRRSQDMDTSELRT